MKNDKSISKNAHVKSLEQDTSKPAFSILQSIEYVCCPQLPMSKLVSTVDTSSQLILTILTFHSSLVAGKEESSPEDSCAKTDKV